MITKLGKAESYSLFGANGMMERNERVHISRGTKIFAFGQGMNTQTFVVYDDDMNAVEICSGDPSEISEYDLEGYFSPYHHIDDTTRPISQKFGIGFYYDESDEVVSDDIIEKSLQRAENLRRLQEEVDRRREEEEKAERDNLIKKYGYLQRAERYDHKTCGNNIRAELKREFPGTKFSVKYESFSGGNAFHIRWTNGPSENDVRALLGKYADMHADYTGDFWDCSPSIFNDLFGSVGYISTYRDEREEKAEKVAGACRIVDYSEKSFAVIGDTRALKDSLKSLGGKFNPRLSCGAGWIFSNRKRGEVEKLIGC